MIYYYINKIIKKENNMKHKPEYEITKTRFEVEREKIKAKLDATCPECGNYDIWNSGLTDGEYDFYTCRKCGTKWRILREDYKNRRSRMQKENFLLILIPIISVITLLLVFGVSN